jgi:hypothetical protein
MRSLYLLLPDGYHGGPLVLLELFCRIPGTWLHRNLRLLRI